MVGVCIKYMHENYGGILQAYATVSYLENQNIEYELVRYTRKKTVTDALKDVPRLFNAFWFNSRYEGIQRKLSLKKHPEYAKNNESYILEDYENSTLDVLCKKISDNEIGKSANNIPNSYALSDIMYNLFSTYQKVKESA